VLKSSGRPEGDHATHLWGWIEKPIAQISIWKCPYVDDTIEGGPMMWVSSTMDGNRQEGKWLAIEHKALKWANANSAPSKGSPWWVPMVKRKTMTSSS
jgi:hypothetical protein